MQNNFSIRILLALSKVTSMESCYVEFALFMWHMSADTFALNVWLHKSVGLVYHILNGDHL